MTADWQKIYHIEIKVLKPGGFGYPEVIRIKWQGKWYRHVHFSTDQDLRLTQYLKEHCPENVKQEE